MRVRWIWVMIVVSGVMGMSTSVGAIAPSSKVGGEIPLGISTQSIEFDETKITLYGELQEQALGYVRKTMLEFHSGGKEFLKSIQKEHENDLVSIVDFLIQLHLTRMVYNRFSNIYVFGEESLDELFVKITETDLKPLAPASHGFKGLIRVIAEHFFLNEELEAKERFNLRVQQSRTQQDLEQLRKEMGEKIKEVVQRNGHLMHSSFRMIVDPLDGTQDFLGKGDNQFESTRGKWYAHASALFVLEQREWVPLAAALESPGQNRRLTWLLGDQTRYTSFSESSQEKWIDHQPLRVREDLPRREVGRIAVIDLSKRLGHAVIPNSQFLKEMFKTVNHTSTGGGGMQVALISYLTGYSMEDPAAFHLSLYMTAGQPAYDIMIGAVLAQGVEPNSHGERIITRYWDIAPKEGRHGMPMPPGLGTGSPVFPIQEVYLKLPHKYRAIALGLQRTIEFLLEQERKGNPVFVPVAPYPDYRSVAHSL